MIRHIVAIRKRPEVEEAAMLSILAEIEGLRAQLAGMRSVTFGRSDSPEKIERGYTHALVVDFDDWAALAAYADDEGHRAIGSRIVEAARGGVDGLLVLDLLVEG